MSTNRTIASPLARHLAEQAGLDINQVRGSGPKGRVIKRDIEAALADPQAASKSAPKSAAAASTPAAAAPHAAIMPPLAAARAFYQTSDYDENPLDMMRAAIATRLTQSTQQIPHFYLTRTLDIDPLMAYRATVNQALADHGEKISLNDLLVRAAALALIDVPEVNVSFAGDAICTITMPILASLWRCPTG